MGSVTIWRDFEHGPDMERYICDGMVAFVSVMSSGAVSRSNFCLATCNSAYNLFSEELEKYHEVHVFNEVACTRSIP